MALNVPMARKVLEHVTAHPEEFEMGTFGLLDALKFRSVAGVVEQLDFCGTAACLAGWTCLLDGETEIGRGGYAGVESSAEDNVKISGQAIRVEVNGIGLGVEERALQILAPGDFVTQARLSDIFWHIDNDDALQQFAALIEEGSELLDLA